jgi:hypothetical protein
MGQLKDLQRDRPNIGAELTLWRLIDLLIAYFKRMKELEERIEELNPYDSIPIRRTMRKEKMR